MVEERIGVDEGALLGDIVVFEREDRVGGRERSRYRGMGELTREGTTTVYPHGDERLKAVELGASIFVDANRNLMKAVKVCLPLEL